MSTRELRRALRPAGELVAEQLALVEPTDEHEPLPVLCPGSGVASEVRAQDEPGHQEHGRTEHHEAWQQHAVGDELGERDAERSGGHALRPGDP